MKFFGQINLEKSGTLCLIFCVSFTCFIVSQNVHISSVLERSNNAGFADSSPEDTSGDQVINYIQVNETIKNESEQDFKLRMEKTFANRRKRIDDICGKFGQGRGSIKDKGHTVLKTLERFLWDSGSGTVYCPIAKVASTSWTASMLEMAGVNLGDVKNLSHAVPDMAAYDKRMEGVEEDEEEMQNNDSWENEPGGRGIRMIARSIFLAPAHEKKDKKSLMSVFSLQDSLMIVRHPFHRLISAYEDKMLNPHPFPYKFHHGIQQAIKEAREGEEEKKDQIKLPADLLLSVRYRQLLRNRVTTMEELRDQPSFREFVQFLIEERKAKKDRVDPKSWKGTIGWSPMYTVCPVCNLNFTYVIKLENMVEEAEYFKKIHNFKMEKFSHLHTAGGDANSRNKIKDYFSTLDKKQIEKLKNIYKYDLLLFDYDIEEIYKYGINK